MIYDTIIVGGGVGGLSCAIYLLRAGKKVLLIERRALGGQTALIDNIENYPGYAKVNGLELAENMSSQALALGLDVKYGDVIDFSLSQDIKSVSTAKQTFQGKTVVLAMGSKVRELDAPGEKQFLGSGVSYCATCDGAFFKGKTVAVVGGGNGAAHEAAYLSGLAKKVYIIHRRTTLKAELALIQQIDSEKVQMLMPYRVKSLSGDNTLKMATLENTATGEQLQLDLDGIFVAIGKTPDTDNLKDLTLDDGGYIVTNEQMETNLSGVYAIGDVRNTPFRQIVTACSDGAIASVAIGKYLANLK